MRTLALAAFLVVAALALSGCERLCDQTTLKGVFCPETPDNELNDAPVVTSGITFGPRVEFAGCPNHINTRQKIVFKVVVTDPNNDPLLYEWDLNGDGAYEAGGTEPSRIYQAPAAITVRVRVTDFPYNLGAPETIELTRRVIIGDPAVNRPSNAAFTASAPAVVGSGVVFDAGATTDPDGFDADALAYGWDFGDGSFNPGPAVIGPGLRTVTHTYQAAGDYTVRLAVQSCFGGHGEAETRISVRPESPSDRAPRARFSVIPASPLAGQTVALDGSPSTDPNGQIVRYEWDLNGDGTFERSGSEPSVETRFEAAGTHLVRLRVTDDEGLVSADAGSIEVRADTPPAASFTVFPPAPPVGVDVRFDASGSSDGDFPITRYEWDFDGNGSFEVDKDREPQHTIRFATAGERFVRLRVTGSAGVTAITGRTVVVGASATARAAQAPPAPVVFTATLEGAPLRPGTVRRRGSRRSLSGVVGRGTLRARVRGDAPAGVARLLNAPWRTRVSFSVDRRRRFRASGIALAQARGSAACLRLRLDGRPGRHPTGRLTLLGGRGSGARLRGTAELRFRIERDGSASVLGALRVRTGKARAIPRACARLATARAR
jgi:PKD repeat protein